MTDIIEAGAEAGGEYEAAPEIEAQEQQQPAATGEEAQSEPQPEKPPLPYEEVEKRWKDTKAAVREERRARQSLERQIADLRAKVEQPAEVYDPKPDPQAEPVAYIEWLDRQLDAANHKAAQAQQAQHQTAEQERATQEVVTAVQEAEAEVADEHPDYYEAVAFLRGVRVKEYTALGYSQAEAEQQTDADAFTHAQQLIARNANPASAFYKLARERGFSKGPSKLETIARGQAAAKSLSAGGGRGNDSLDAGGVAELKGAAFDAAFEKLRQKARSSGY